MKISEEKVQHVLVLAEKKLAKAMEVYRKNKKKIPERLGEKFQKLLNACFEFLEEFKRILKGEGKIYG